MEQEELDINEEFVEINEYQYAFFKGLAALMFVDRPLELLPSVLNLYYGDFDYTLLVLFSGTILAYQETMNEKMKENAHAILSLFDSTFRESNSVEREDGINLCNELSVIVNGATIDNKKLTKELITEMIARGYSKTDAFLLTSPKQISRTHDVINNQRVLDFSILYTHVAQEDRTYYDAMKEAVLNNETDYIKSLTFVIMEYPKLLQNKMFLDRLNELVNALEDNNMNKFSKRYAKYMKKELKRFNNMFE